MSLKLALLLIIALPAFAALADDAPPLSLDWKDNYLTIHGPNLPGGEVRIHYLEAYCRPGSTKRKWAETTIGHHTKRLDDGRDPKRVELECTLNDGLIVHHEIRAATDEVSFDIIATNPTDKASAAHWAQPCVRVDRFTGGDKNTYLTKCFIFLDGKLSRMPTPNWATEALYTPGQVWAAPGVDRDDVNPRPLSDARPSNGLIGCYSADEKMILAIAFEPYQELFQGVAACLHADFRLGGVAPGETKRVRGKIYIFPADTGLLLKRYRADFPEQARKE